MNDIKKLFKIDEFSTAINKLYENEEMSNDSAEYILGCAILLLEEYNKSGDKDLFELAYNIILRYTVLTGDITPLNDVSCNYGFYPTVRYIYSKSTVQDRQIEDVLINCGINRFKSDNYIETYEQHKTKSEIINSTEKNISFIAPTSFGKSSLIMNHLISKDDYSKSLILVPSKSLISQTYLELRKRIRNRKIICHDSMYKGEKRFVGVMTQERALRFLSNNNSLNIDCLYIDEAHNILDNDPRSIILSRVIKICNQRNPKLQTIYLSPFVSNSKNLLQGNDEFINEQRIDFSVKEPNIFVLDNDTNNYIYDRFSNRFYHIGDNTRPFEYIKINERRKNFIFLNSPKKIEEFANELYENTYEIEDKESIVELQEILSKNIHRSFKMNQYLNHGIIYLHAKIPDQIKDYLEEQFKKNDAIKYLIANSVILEGINLPIDCLFIFDVWSLSNSRVLNLMGRVNRLNNIYDNDNGDLRKLLPNIHFVNSNYCKQSMINKVKKIYKKEDDEVKNPILNNYNPEKLKGDKKKKANEIAKNREITEQENIYFSSPKSELDKLRKALVASGMNQLISISDNNVKKIYKNIESVNRDQPVLNLVKAILIENIKVINFEFERLKNESALNYYAFLLNEQKHGDLAKIVSAQLAYYERVKDENPYMYIGKTFGEINPNRDSAVKLYIDLRTKRTNELINLLIVKTKIEQDFISFQYNRAVGFLHDYEIITDDQYNLEVYGTTDEKQISMLSFGISKGILNLLNSKHQIENIKLDDTGNLIGNSQLKIFRNQQDSFIRFELDKYIYFED